MGSLKLRIFPDPVLRVKAKDVEDFKGIGTLVKEMAGIMYESNGIGLAAPQVGVSKRILIIDVGDGLREFINPRITQRAAKKTKMEEGCLSVPGVGVTVWRPERIKLKAFDADGEPFTEEYKGLAARAVQHECDHLDGKVILDYLDPVRYFITARKFKTPAKTRKGKTCEVACNDGKRHTKRS
jgi:peptide deformylase